MAGMNDGHGGHGLAWDEHPGRHVTVLAPRGSDATTLASVEVREADRVVVVLEELLSPSQRRRCRPFIYLVDPVIDLEIAAREPAAPSASSSLGIGEHAILRVVQSGVNAQSLTYPLVHLLVREWLGPAAAAATPFISGMAGVVAARSHTGRSTVEADDWVRGQLAAGHPVSVLSSSAPARPDETGGPDPAATSFVAFLLATYGKDCFRRFLSLYDPARRDEAAMVVYRQPSVALQTAWLTALRRDREGPTLRPAFRYFFRLLAPYRWRYAEVLFYQVMAAALAMTLPLASRCVVSALEKAHSQQSQVAPDAFCRVVLPAASPGRLAALGLILSGAYLASGACSVRRARVEERLFLAISRSLQERLFAHLQRLSHAFYSDAKIGDLSSRLLLDTRNVEACMGQIFGITALTGLTALAAVVTAVALSPAMGMLLLVVIPIFLVINRAFGTRTAQVSREALSLTGEMAAATEENLSGHAVVKAFGVEERATTSFGARATRIANANVRLAVMRQLFVQSAEFVIQVTGLLVLVAGGYLVFNNSISQPATLVTLLLLLPFVLHPLPELAGAAQSAQAALASIERINEVLEHPVEVADRPDAVALSTARKEIRLEQVLFGYDRDRQVLNGLDLTIPVGTYVAIVGPSGSGKSTIVNLLLRFWDPDEGRILIDGQDLRDISLASLRAQIGIVFQDTFIFNSTLRENIAIGRPEATDAEVDAAARAAQLDAFVQSLPAGYDTVLGERGVRMSGGQRQRLAIARAILRDPAILVLDEATSALDAHTEAAIVRTFEGLGRGRTTVAITHRLALARAADLIVVLDHGRIIEQGTHADLVEAGGLYQQLYAEQTGQAKERHDDGSPLVVARLGKLPLFAELPNDVLCTVAERLKPECYDIDQELVRQGEPGEKLYILRTGAAEVLVGDGDGERRVNILHEGDYFGECTLLTEQRRTATVRAMTPTEVYALGRDDFLALVRQQAKLRERVSHLVFTRRAAYDTALLAAGLAVHDKPAASDDY
jgi:ABC-type multidrug transport system fused ATPase/permease subunit